MVLCNPGKKNNYENCLGFFCQNVQPIQLILGGIGLKYLADKFKRLPLLVSFSFYGLGSLTRANNCLDPCPHIFDTYYFVMGKIFVICVPKSLFYFCLELWGILI
jgi:hypothetical protein